MLQEGWGGPRLGPGVLWPPALGVRQEVASRSALGHARPRDPRRPGGGLGAQLERRVGRHDDAQGEVREVPAAAALEDVPGARPGRVLGLGRVVDEGHAGIGVAQALAIDDPPAHRRPEADGVGRARLQVGGAAVVGPDQQVLAGDVPILAAGVAAVDLYRERDTYIYIYIYIYMYIWVPPSPST